VVELGWFTYWNAMYVVMIAMVLHTLNSALMMYATFTESTSLLVVSMILRLELLVFFIILRFELLVVFMILRGELLVISMILRVGVTCLPYGRFEL
jgi:hypothetical protein